MSIVKILSSLEEYLELKKKEKEGESGLEEKMCAAQKHFVSLLNEYVDFRVAAAFDKEEKQKRNSIIPQRITIPDPSIVWADILALIHALHSSPKPPREDIVDLELWIKEYRSWYKNERAIALNAIPLNYRK